MVSDSRSPSPSPDPLRSSSSSLDSGRDIVLHQMVEFEDLAPADALSNPSFEFETMDSERFCAEAGPFMDEVLSSSMDADEQPQKINFRCSTVPPEYFGNPDYNPRFVLTLYQKDLSSFDSAAELTEAHLCTFLFRYQGLGHFGAKRPLEFELDPKSPFDCKAYLNNMNLVLERLKTPIFQNRKLVRMTHNKWPTVDPDYVKREQQEMDAKSAARKGNARQFNRDTMGRNLRQSRRR